jgi:hypothetical protein
MQKTGPPRPSWRAGLKFGPFLEDGYAAGQHEDQRERDEDAGSPVLRSEKIMEEEATPAIFPVRISPVFGERDIRIRLSDGGGHGALIPSSLD